MGVWGGEADRDDRPAARVRSELGRADRRPAGRTPQRITNGSAMGSGEVLSHTVLGRV